MPVQITTFGDRTSKAAVQLTENDATHTGKLVNMAQYAERATMPRNIHLRNNNNKELKQLISKFPSILDGVCRPVKGPPYHFKLRDGVVPSTVKSIGPHWTAHTLFKRIIHKGECNQNQVGSVNCEIWRLQYHCSSILPRLRPVESCPSILFTNSCQWFAGVLQLMPRSQKFVE
ncbi:hypothetical protein T4E_6129 [Trichinella pseudospiralis]|uniref:Uncharacterized protein n=1 Tax=Trichinella pseudospiralis TaxID=6337 RepID=A0A0V0XN72_TRIPS|nr:hypothetical protein T4E_6129 [Trichinella pseudospiralis]